MLYERDPVPAAPAPGEIAGVWGAASRYQTAHGNAERYWDEPFGHAGGHGCREPDGSHFGWSAAPAPEATREADDLWQSDALEVLCRVFDDGADVAHDEWLAWYKPSEWLNPYRALGAFIRNRLAAERAAQVREIETLRARVKLLDRVITGHHEALVMREEHDVCPVCTELGPAFFEENDRITARAPEPQP